ncbi:MAG: hypothetical protein ACLFQJ_06070 [Campylobacterales bacterium]
MFNIDGDVLILDFSLGYEECAELQEFLKDKLKYLSRIEFEQDSGEDTPSSALVALLLSIKKSYENIEIPALQDGFESNFFGKIKIAG